MTLETVTILLAATNGAFLVGTPILLYLVNRGTFAAAKIANLTPSQDQLKAIEQMAYLVINFAQEQTTKFLKGLVKEGPMTGEQKLEVAVGAMQTLAKQANIVLSDETAKIAIEATLQASRGAVPSPFPSLLPSSAPPPSLAPLPSSAPSSSGFPAHAPAGMLLGTAPSAERSR